MFNKVPGRISLTRARTLGAPLIYTSSRADRSGASSRAIRASQSVDRVGASQSSAPFPPPLPPSLVPPSAAARCAGESTIKYSTDVESAKCQELVPKPGFLPRDVVRVSRKSDKPSPAPPFPSPLRRRLNVRRPPGNKSGRSLPSRAEARPFFLPGLPAPRGVGTRFAPSALSILKRNRTRGGRRIRV